MVLLCCACIVCYPHLPTGNVTRKPEVAKQLSCMSPRSNRADDIDHVKERTWILSWYYGAAVAADDVEHAQFLWEAGKVLAAHSYNERGPNQVYLQFSRLL